MRPIIGILAEVDAERAARVQSTYVKGIEALYSTDHPYLRAYQWHPERLYEKDGYNRKIFEDFIAACKGNE